MDELPVINNGRKWCGQPATHKRIVINVMSDETQIMTIRSRLVGCGENVICQSQVAEAAQKARFNA